MCLVRNLEQFTPKNLKDGQLNTPTSFTKACWLIQNHSKHLRWDLIPGRFGMLTLPMTMKQRIRCLTEFANPLRLVNSKHVTLLVCSDENARKESTNGSLLISVKFCQVCGCGGSINLLKAIKTMPRNPQGSYMQLPASMDTIQNFLEWGVQHVNGQRILILKKGALNQSPSQEFNPRQQNTTRPRNPQRIWSSGCLPKVWFKWKTPWLFRVGGIPGILLAMVYIYIGIILYIIKQ